MDYVTLGRTEIKVCKNGFGALPIQRISFDSAKEILLHAYNSGINFFDTARFYTDSEEKIGYALSDVRDKIYIATKTAAQNADDFWKDLNTSLNNMKTDYIDIYQFHNPSFCPKPNDGTGLYEAMLEAKAQGKIRFIGLTNHRLAVAQEAIDSVLYDTIQFPFCYLATDKDIAIVENCKKNNSTLHLYGLLSDGGVHSHNTHLYALLELAKRQGLTDVCVHCFLDGRDTAPTSGKEFIEELEAKIKEIGVGQIASIEGRYYAMDRDNRWDRVEKAYAALVYGEGNEAADAVEAIQASYDNDKTDEFVIYSNQERRTASRHSKSK